MTKQKQKPKPRFRLNIACWNMRSLVQAEGSVDTAVSRPGRGVAVDRKVDLMVNELKKYSISVTGISETKWFGQEVYSVSNFTVLHSGRPRPEQGERVERNEGVAIVLDQQMTDAWRAAGEEWKAVSSRIVVARVKTQSAYKHPVYITIVSVYAPTHRSPQERKDEFYRDLQDTINSVRNSDVLLVIGDFNARVGSSHNKEDRWYGTRGLYGVGKCNESGEALLSFCAVNELIIMNTMFMKSEAHKYTWQHPGSKKWHCIDYILMKSKDRRLCCDVTVLRSAECWTDHKLLRVQLRLKRPPKIARGHKPRKFNISVLTNDETRSNYVEAVVTGVEAQWDQEDNAEGKWNTIKEIILEAAKDKLGFETRHHPDWFKENYSTLLEVIEKRNNLLQRWLRSHQTRDRQRYVAQRRLVATEIKMAKNTWFQNKAQEVEAGMLTGNSGKGAWKGLKDIQKGRSGLRPVRSRGIRNCEGQLCTSAEQISDRWREHFESVLNTTSTYSEASVNSLWQYPLRPRMSNPPSEEEIIEAIDKLKRNKVGGSNGILPELLKSSGAAIIEHIQDLFDTVWREGQVPQEWRDATLIPIPKKGDLSLCDNWRGISLLDVFGKALAKVIQARLQEVVEEVLPDSQCGFRQGRGCIDMVFCVKQLIEKSVEHNTTTYMLFIDLRKAYDSVPRQALWHCLEKYGIPPRMVNIIRSFHEGMQTSVSVNGENTPVFEVRNGLRQGCTIAPTLFNLYFNAVVSAWRDRCKPFGVDILYKLGGKLVGERTRKPETTILTEFLFADDAAAVCSTREEVEKAARILDETTRDWGLTMSFPKTKLLVAGPQPTTDEPPITIDGKRLR